MSTSRMCFLTLVACLAATGAMAQSDVDIQKFTNGQNADAPPGPAVIVGSTVNWSYVVSNTGSRLLTNISVTDDQGEVVSCPATTLDVGISFTCTASGTAVAGQYTNIGTVSGTLPDSTVVSDTDPSHYFGQTAAAVSIQTRTNGVDADAPPGPLIPSGSTVSWDYEVTNIGIEDLDNIDVSDDHGVPISCPGSTLAVAASMTCTASGVAQAGQYANLGSVTAHLVVSDNDVAASDPSHYYGQTLSLVKRTNGVDVTALPGPIVVPGSTVNWTYEVTNSGPATVTGLTVTDDQGVVVSCAQTTLTAGATVICTGSGTAIAGQYTNIGTAQATLPLGGVVAASDSSFYFGNALQIEKSTNGVDADLAPGPSITPGTTVNWTYVVTNAGSETLTAVSVTDDQGVVVSCPATTLDPATSMTCTASGVAISGQYANVGTADATSPTLGALSASDPSHYFGQDVQLDFGDAPDPAFQSLLASNGARHVLGSGVFLGACVDAEPDAFANAAADGDDTNVGTEFGTCAVPGDDEDGVTFTTPVRVGLSSTVDVIASAPCTLSAWIDFARDGDFGDAGEDLFPGGTPLAAGTNSLMFAVPASASPGPTYARFRCTSSGVVGFTGEAADGEVEDYAINIVVPAPAIAATKNDALLVDINSDTFPGPGDTLRYTIVISNSGTGGANGVVFTDIPDSNTSLVAGSVTTTSGTVTTGNGGGDTSVSVNIGTITALGGSTSITFDVVIGNPLPVGVTTVANQGTISGGNFASVPTDDPALGGGADPTVTALTVPPSVTATKNDALLIDLNADTFAGPGDTLRYTIVISNSGTGAANSVVFSDSPDSNTSLVAGSVTTTAGTVTTGNGGGDTSVSVNVGTIAALGGSASITFDVVIDDPVAAGVTTVSNQGTVSGSNFANVPTDDPAVGGGADPTVTGLTLPPSISASKTDSLFIDVDGDGIAEPGDTLLYTIIVSNSGAGSANGVAFNDTPGANTTLVIGSVATTSGSVVTGNTAGDTTVGVSVGAVASAGASATIMFRVTINYPIPGGVTSVSNQGTVSGTNFANVLTDDPAAAGGADPTVTPLTATPMVTASKTASLQVDVDHDGFAEPGDTIRYSITVMNGGNTDATGVTFSDTPDPNTALVVGSVTSTSGAVTLGNGVGNSTVGVSIGTLAGNGGSATIVFDVRINDPFPPNAIRVVNIGTVSGSNFSTIQTDDPSLPGSNDPTAYPVLAVIATIPTLNTLALLALLGMLTLVGLRRTPGR